jgi:hypothetical protein
MAVQQRTGINTRHIWYPETTVDVDPGAPVGYVLPQAATDTVLAAAPQNEALVYTGDGNAPGVVLGETTVSGNIMMGLEYTTLGNLIKALFGSSAAPVTTNTTNYVHFFPFSPSTPLSGQLQKESLEPTIQYVRNRAIRVDTLRFPLPTQGPAQVEGVFMGYGDEVQADLAGTKNNNGYLASSVFNAMVTLGGTRLATVTGATPEMGRKLSRASVVANQGIAGSVNAGLFRAFGPISLLFDTTNNLTFYNQAINQTQLALEFVWANQIFGLETQFMYVKIPFVLFERKGFPVGGETGISITQNFKAIYNNAFYDNGLGCVSKLGTGGPPQTFSFVTGVSDKLGFKVDGGATLTATLTGGSPQTVAQIIASIGATFTGATVDAFPGNVSGAGATAGGRLRVRTNSTVAAGSIQCDTSVAQTASTILGFDNTVRANKAPQSAFVYVYNQQSTQY